MLENIPQPKMFEVGSDSEMRALSIVGANSYWVVRVSTDPGSVWRWQPESTLADSSANGVLKPDSLSTTQPGRWVFVRWESAVSVERAEPVTPYRVWDSGNLDQNDSIGIAAYQGIAAGTFTVTAGSNLRLGSVIYVMNLGSGGLSFIQGSGATLVAPDGVTMDGSNSIATLTLIATNTWLLTGKVTNP